MCFFFGEDDRLDLTKGFEVHCRMRFLSRLACVTVFPHILIFVFLAVDVGFLLVSETPGILQIFISACGEWAEEWR